MRSRCHLPSARAQPGRLCASCCGSAGREGRPGVAAPLRPWLPRQCRRPAPRCRRCPRRPGRGRGRGSLPGRLRGPAGHAGSCEGRTRRELRGFGRPRVSGGRLFGCGTEAGWAALPCRWHLPWARRPWRSGPHNLGGRAAKGAVLASAWLLDDLVLPREFLRPRRSFFLNFAM